MFVFARQGLFKISLILQVFPLRPWTCLVATWVRSAGDDFSIQESVRRWSCKISKCRRAPHEL